MANLLPSKSIVGRFTPLVTVVTLVVTGVVVPTTRVASRRPVLESRVQTLSLARVKPGYFRALDTGLPTELVGFEWKSRKPGAVGVRVKQGSAWGPWLRVDGEPAEGPDTASRENKFKTTAGPVWVGKGKTRVEVKVLEGELDGLRMHAIRSEDAPPPPGIRPATASVPLGSVISRASWGADESLRKVGPGCTGTPEYANGLRMAVVHHTAMSNAYTAADSAAMVRAMYYFHTKTNGWCDIGYNFVVDRFGKVFEGRAGGIDRTVVGAHASGYNYASTGVAVLGSYGTVALPDVAEASLRRLLAWKLALHGVDPSGQVDIAGRKLPTILGHGDLGSTACPGAKIAERLPAIRSATSAAVKPELVMSPYSSKYLDVAGAIGAGGLVADGSAVVQMPARAGNSQQWRLIAVAPQVRTATAPAATPTTAPAATAAKATSATSPPYMIVAGAGGKVLQVAGASNADGAAIVLGAWTGARNQQWRLETEAGSTRIVSVASGKVLDLKGGSTADATPVVQWPWIDSPSQHWQLKPAAAAGV